MRALAVLCVLSLSAALAGCAGAGDREPFRGTCPQWVKGLSTAVFQEGFLNTSVPEQKFDPARPTGAGLRGFQGHPLDFVDLDFNPTKRGDTQAIGVANGTLELRVFRSDGNGGVSEQLLLQHTRTHETRDVWTWGPGVHANFTLKVALAEPHEPPRTDPIVLRWDFLPDQSTRTPSEAVMLYTAYFWYRTCNADGSEATLQT